MNKLKYIILLTTCFSFIKCTKQINEPITANKIVKVVNPELAWRAKAPLPGPAREIILGESNVLKLENGLQVIVVENHKLPRVSYQISLDHDPILEGDQAGYISMAGDLLSNGTTTKSKAQIDEAIDFIGANLSTSASGMFGNSLVKNSDKLLEIMSDILYNPSFPEDEFEKLKQQQLSSIEAAKTNPNQIVANVASVLNYGSNHPYGEIVTAKSIENASIESCKKYFDTYFRPNNAYLTIVGDITLEEARIKAQKYFGKWKSGVIPVAIYEAPKNVEGQKVAIVNKDGAVQSVIRITYPINLQPGDDDLIKARVMNSILGGSGFSGRLMQNLREDKAFTYGARSSIVSDDLVGNFRAYASVRNEVTDSSVNEFIYEMNRIKSESVNKEDLALIKSSLTGGFGRSLESPQTIARFARNIIKYNLPKDYYQTYLQKLDAVTVADVQEMAKKYIRPENSNIIVVGSKDDITDKLLRFDSDGTIDYYDAFGNSIEYDNSVIPEDISAQTIINDYLTSIGGAEKLKAIKSILFEGSMSLMGQSISYSEMFLAPNLYKNSMTMGGTVIQEQIFNGEKGLISGQMGKQVLTEGSQFEELKYSAVMFAQLNYENDGYVLDLKGIEDVDGQKAYKVEVTQPNEEKSFEYYDMKSGLLLLETKTISGPDGSSQTLSTGFEDYRSIDGIMFPFKNTLSGAMPQPIQIEKTNIKLNSDVSKDMFEIN